MPLNEDSDISARDALNNIVQGARLDVDAHPSTRNFDFLVVEMPKKISDRTAFLNTLSLDGWWLAAVQDRVAYLERPTPNE